MKTGELTSHKRDWERLAELDPLWAVLSHKDKRNQKWDPAEFFETGRAEIAELMARVSPMIRERRRALDFGCGVGRLTRALASFFEEAYGVDISEAMIARAKVFTPECHFVVNTKSDLSLFSDNHFDLVYSNIVLQHQPNKAFIRAYISEFLRVLKSGGVAVFGVPHKKSLRNRLNAKRAAFNTLSVLGVKPAFLYRCGLHTMRMTAIPVHEVEEIVTSSGAQLLSAESSSSAHFSVCYTAQKL